MDLARAANRLTARWARSLIVDGSVVFSGAGVWPIIAILASAADGPAREELSAAAGVDSADGLKSALQLINSIHGGDTHLAVGLWTNAHLALAEWWAANVPAQLRGLLTGRAAVDQAELDRWASEHTGGQIQSIGIELKEEERWQDSTLLVAASALSIDTRWKEPFEVGAMEVTAGPWANRRLLSLWRSTLNLNDVAIAQDTAVGPLTLLEVRGAADIDVVLATASEIHSPGEVLIAACNVLSDDLPLTHGSELAEGDAAPALSVAKVESFEPTPHLRISVPPFTLSTRHTVTEYPDVFGLRTLMDRRRGHLPKISEFPLALDKGVQQVTASFSTKGFRAAAVSAMDIMAGASGERFSTRCLEVVFDRPFAFLARHRPTGLLVVVGLVADAQDFDWS
jgi:serine protease inhibitor